MLSLPLCRLRMLATAATIVLALTALDTGAFAQGYIYALNSEGRVAVNGAQIANLKGGLRVNDDDLDGFSDLDEAWWGIAIDGPDWWVLRFDGNLNRDGVAQDPLGFDNVFEEVWIDLLFFEGDRWALRSDGRININGEAITNLNDGDFFFKRFVSDDTDVWSLRSDGRMFRNLIEPADFEFNAPDGVGDDDDGESLDTRWVSVAVDPLDGEIYGLRRDGRLGAADPDLFGGADGDTVPNAPNVATLPFPDEPQDVELGELYQDIEFLPDGSWLVLRVDGRIYAEADPFNPLVNLPGDPDDLTDSSIYVDLLTLPDGQFFTLRQDGRIYQGTNGEAILDLAKDSYRELAFGTEFPDLGNIKTQKPVITRYTTKAVTGQPVVVPVPVTDVDTPPEDVTLTLDLKTLPAGAVWDAKARTVTWDDPGPKGSYKLKFTADDGVNKAVNKTVSIKVKDPDDNPDKNKKPQPTKIKNATALDGVPISLPIIVTDVDGDDLTITVDDTEYPYTAGAVFDTKTNVFSWNAPTLEDVGKLKLQFEVTDGTVIKKFKVQLKTEATLLTFP